MFTKKNSAETEMLQLSLATPSDMEVIGLLSGNYGHGMPADVRTNLLVARPVFAVSPHDQVIKATDAKGDIVASVRLGIAQTREELNEQFQTSFSWEMFPVMTVKEACAVSNSSFDKALRLLSLQLANLMEINDTPICAQIGEIVGFNALAAFDMKMLPPHAHPSYIGKAVLPSPRVGNVIYKAGFRDAIEELINNGVPLHRLVGALPFEQYFDPGVVQNLRTVLQGA